MSEFCNSSELWAGLANARRIGRRVQNLKSGTQNSIFCTFFSNIALRSILTAATASAKHFGVNVIKYFAVLCINAAVTRVTISNFNKFQNDMRLVIWFVSWRQKKNNVYIGRLQKTTAKKKKKQKCTQHKTTN